MPFLTDLENSVTTSFAAVANPFGAALLGVFTPAFVIGFGIWISIIAYDVAFGSSDEPFSSLFKKIGKIFLIGTLALRGWPEVADLLGGIRDAWAGGGNISTTLHTALIDPLAAVWVELWRWFAQNMQPLSWTDIVDILNIIVIFIATVVMFALMSLAVGVFAAVALAMFLVANTIFTLLLAVGPFFLLCLAFPFLQRFFESFIGSVMTAIFALGFTVLMVLFVSNLFGLNNMASIVPSATATVSVQEFSRFGKSMAALFATKLVTAALIIYLYYKVFDLAAALGGGLNMGSNVIRGASRLISASRSGSRNSTNPANGSVNRIAQGSSGGGNAARNAGRGVGAVARAGAANVARIASQGAGAVAGISRSARSGSSFAYNRTASARNSINSVG